MLGEFFFFIVGHIIRLIVDSITLVLSPFIFIYYGYTRNKFIEKKSFQSIFITGGSSGIGKAIAIKFVSENPSTNIIITGTNKSRLSSAIKEIERVRSSKALSNQSQSSNSNSVTTNNAGGNGGKTIGEIIDVRNKEGMKEYINKIDSQYSIDLLIANAGTSAAMTSVPHYFVSSKEILDVNCQGFLNTILPIIPLFQERKSLKKGTIACVGSLAGYISNNKNGSYGGSKAYIRFVCDDLRPKLKLIGNIDLNYIAPGYVRSRMCKEELYKDNIGFMNENDAANIIYNGLRNNDSIIAFPGKVATLAWWVGSLHPILNTLVWDRMVSREQAAQQVGFFHEFDPNDEFGGEC